MKNLIVFCVLMVGASSVSYAIQKNACEAKIYDIPGEAPKKFMYCAGTMSINDVPRVGMPVSVSVIPSGDSPRDCSRIKQVFVNNKVNQYLSSSGGNNLNFSACLIPRKPLPAADNTIGLYIGGSRLYDPRVYHQKLILDKYAAGNSFNLRALHRARLKEYGFNLPADGEICFPTTNTDPQEIKKMNKRKLSFRTTYPQANNDIEVRVMDRKDATCAQILDALARPEEIVPPAWDVMCSISTKLCEVKSPSFLKPSNPILKVINADLSKVVADKDGKFPFGQYLDMLPEPYGDVIDFVADGTNVEITYKQPDIDGQFRE